MKTILVSTIILFTFSLFTFLPHTAAEGLTTVSLPEGAVARLGKGNVRAIAYSPNGSQLAVAGSAGIWLYDAETGTEQALLTGHTDEVISVVFSPDGTTIASGGGSNDRTVCIWDAETGELRYTFTGHTDEVVTVAFSPDSTTLASSGGHYDRTVRLWDADTWVLRHTLTGHTGGVRSVAFSPDSTTLASNGGQDATVRLWDADTGELQHTLTGHTDSVNSVAFSPDGNTIATGSYDTTARLWDAETWELRHTLEHTDYVFSVAFSPDSTTLTSGSADRAARLWDAETGKLHGILTGHTDYVFSVAFSPDGNTIATGGYSDWTVRLWDADTRELRHTLVHGGNVYSVVFSPDGNTIVGWGGDSTVRLWQVDTGEPRYTLTGHTDGGRSVAFSPDGNTIAGWGGSSTVRLWDMDTGELRHTLEHRSTITDVVFSPDGYTIATGSLDVRLWDAETGRLRDILTGHTDYVNSVAFSPDGYTIASGSRDATVGLWDVETGEHYNPLIGHTDSVNSVAFSPDGNTIASGSSDGTVRLWGADGGELTLTGHTYGVEVVAFSPDGTTLASSGGYYDRTVRLWDAETGQHLQTLTGHTYGVEGVAFSPDGTTLASSDGTVLLWDLNLILGPSDEVPNGPSDESPNIVEANTPIRGPWLWIIAPTEPGQGGAASTDVDSLAVASGGAVTEADVAVNGATEGDIVGDYAWILAELPEESNVNPRIGNINQMLVTAGVTESSDLDDFSSYALIVLESKTDHSNVTMKVGSDDSIKVWLNGSVVHTNAINRASLGFDDTFTVDLVAGDNLLLVKVSEWIGAWKMDVGIDVDVTVKVPMATPKPMYAAWDVNEDGQVNILDLVVVGQNIGETVAAVPRADVNGDNNIDILDLVLVAGHLGESTHATAPISIVKLGKLDPALVENWLALARIENDGSLVFQQGIANLERLLASLIPQKTALLANYPNPFNPETWIPYQLANPSDVKISIYAADGKLVWTLDLGHQPVGIYQSRNRAAHWNGKNAVGEPVASGVYFYTLTAGDFSATRKMLIRK